MNEETPQSPQSPEEGTPPPILSLDEILAALTPSSDPITLELSPGATLTFKPVTSREEKRRFEKKIGDVLKNLPEIGSKEWSESPLKPVLPKHPEDRWLGAMIHVRSLSPHIPLEAAYRFLKAPETADYIEGEIGRHDKNLYSLASERRIEEARKKSQTLGNDEE